MSTKSTSPSPSPTPTQTESTPLLHPSSISTSKHQPLQIPNQTDNSQPQSQGKVKGFKSIHKVLFTSFLLSMTFAFTQTSLMYSFRTMTCDEYFKTHAVPADGVTTSGGGDRCNVREIEARTAAQIGIMSSITTTSLIINLFVTGYWIKRFGPKAAMFQQTVWAAGRNLCQIWGLTLGGATGMHIIQVTQLFNIMGGAGGYMLAANNYVAILVGAEERTSMFGVLQGMAMLGASVGFTGGGLVYKYFGPIAPFQVTFCGLVTCTIFGSIFLPYIPPVDHSADVEKKQQSFLAPLKMFIPKRRDVDGNGTMRWDVNVPLLGLGAFFSVLATGYVPMALNLVGTNVFGFKPAESGYMLAFFLSICFPKIISHGRAYISHRAPPPSPAPGAEAEHPDSPTQENIPNVINTPSEDLARQPTDKAHGSQFDLYFLRWSIFTDGILTSGVTFATHGWHLYLAAGILPFASGTGSACKGVMLDLVEAEMRSDALSAIALVEKLAQVSTIGMFGYIFSVLSEVGTPTLVFSANAVVAMMGFFFLCFVRMPRVGQIALV